MNLKNARLQKGVLYHDYFKGLFEYGEAVEEQNPPNGLYIIDYGTNKNLPIGIDLVIYVTGGAPWQQDEEMPEWINDECVYVVANFSDKLSSILLAKRLKKKVYRYPIVNGLEISKEEENVFSAIFKNEKDSIISQQ